MTSLMHNIDDIQTEIMALEASTIFDQAAWDRVFGVLASEDRPALLANAMRRAETAKGNQVREVVGSAAEYDQDAWDVVLWSITDPDLLDDCYRRMYAEMRRADLVLHVEVDLSPDQNGRCIDLTLLPVAMETER